MDPEGFFPLIVRGGRGIASDYDGDHAIQPVTVEIQDDKPVFCKVDWGCDNDSKHGVGLIDEDKLDPNGNHDWAPGDDKGGKHADGEIIFDFGADKPGHLEVSNLTVRDSAGNLVLNLALVIDPNDGSIDVSGLNNLKTANGEAITLVATLDEGTGLLTIVAAVLTLWSGIQYLRIAWPELAAKG